MKTGLTRLPLFVAVFFLAFLIFRGAATAGADNDLAIIVNKSGYTVAISSNDLRAMFLGERSQWPNGTKVMAAIPGPDRPEYAATLKNIFRMGESDFKAHFLQAEFTGKEASQLQQLDSAAALKKFVSQNAGAIACIRAVDADDTVRTIRVDGAFPGGDTYKLHLTK